MTVALRPRPAGDAAALRSAMRHAVGGVSVVTAGRDAERTGLTVTTATSLTLEPPTMVVCINQAASAWPVIGREGHFAVNLLAGHQIDVAERFAGRGGAKGAARYDGSEWFSLPSGASGLVGALAVVDCRVSEIIERHTHGIVLGTVLAVFENAGAVRTPLLHRHGTFRSLES